MRILIATGMFPPDIGGPATYSNIIAEEFSKRGHEVVVVTYGGVNSKCKNKNGKLQFKIIKVLNSMPKGIRHIIYFWQILKLGSRADSIYAQDAVSAGFPAALAALLLRKPFFLKIVGDHAWEQGWQRCGVVDTLDEFLGKRYGMGVEFLRMVEKFTARRAKRIVVPSVYLKSVVERWNISSERVAIIANAVSLPKTIPTKEEARRALGLDGFLLVTAGRMVPWKGFGMLVELLPKLLEVIPRVKLVIIGDGPEKKKIELGIGYYTLGDKVVLTGSVPKDRVGMYLAAADIFLLNTGYEGFSHQLIEAMAVGVPIITTNAGGNKEIARDGENALLARYNDLADWKEKIMRIYTDTDLQTQLRKPNCDVLREYSAENMIQKTESLVLNS